MRKKLIASTSFFLFLFAPALFASISLPAVVSDNMVLQQNQKVSLWGWGSPGEKVEVKPDWLKAVSVITNGQGKWSLTLKTNKADGKTHSIRFSSKENTIEISNVLFGEVWLASGQSNMNFPMAKREGWRTGVLNYEQEIAAANYPDIRFFTVAQKVADVPQKDLKGSWELCTPDKAGNFSAVAYYFARELRKELGVPVGIIHSSWGGTVVEAWTKKEILEADADFKKIVDTYNKQVNNPGKAAEGRKAALARWKQDLAEGKLHGIDSVQGPRDLLTSGSNKAPYKLYNAMIAPLIPFTLRGVIWYQGESNMERAKQYTRLFPAMIEGWRKDWNARLPFYFVQIAPHRQQHPEIREAQLIASQTVAKSGMAVITDVGDSADIHPRNKEVPGKRLALIALDKTYKRNIVSAGPELKSMKIKNGRAELKFKNGQGLYAKDARLTQFAIAGPDGRFVPAKARIEGDKVIVWADTIKRPENVRYGWSYVPHAELYNGAGLPASPFRTDKAVWETEGRSYYSDYVN